MKMLYVIGIVAFLYLFAHLFMHAINDIDEHYCGSECGILYDSESIEELMLKENIL